MTIEEQAYRPCEDRYRKMKYRRCGKSGLLLPELSFGLWQNFGRETTGKQQKELIFTAFDLGITHFDLANNYGFPAVGAAEENFGQILREDLRPFRDELIISTKAGYEMWPGPYGNWGSRKYLTASLDQSLKRMGLEYVDIFYHHRPDPDTPLEETMDALSDLVRQGKALYVGISNYKEKEAREAMRLLRERRTPCLVNQIRYNMLERQPEEGVLAALEEGGAGCICFSPLAQGALSGKYLEQIPEHSRAARKGTTVAERYINEKNRNLLTELKALAENRGQTLAQLALSWVLRRQEVTSVLIGASRPEQLLENTEILRQEPLSSEEMKRIDEILDSRLQEEDRGRAI